MAADVTFAVRDCEHFAKIWHFLQRQARPSTILNAFEPPESLAIDFLEPILKSWSSFNTSSWSWNGLQNWFWLCHWDKFALWASHKQLWNTCYTTIECQRHISFTMKTSFAYTCISSIEYISFSKLLMCSPIRTTLGAIDTKNSKTRVGHQCQIAVVKIMSRTEMRMIIHSRTSTKPRNTRFT